ncbi:MAG: type II toxin-antitoxin system prevent-host-death family antitoxin [Deltaproteobacteria bacterium]|nr:type II toxin-antitoxin system prevent-host-death family antitoxin [Deltaproteobacteria bacterium]
MATSYSIYEAKSRLSELLRQVKSGTEVTVTERGEPIAKVIPFPRQESFDDRFQELARSGQLTLRSQKEFPSSGKPITGALKRFLQERE